MTNLVYLVKSLCKYLLGLSDFLAIWLIILISSNVLYVFTISLQVIFFFFIHITSGMHV